MMIFSELAKDSSNRRNLTQFIGATGT